MPMNLPLLWGLLLAGSAAAPEAERLFEVETVRDVAYGDGSDADRIKHKLDLYLPKGAKDYPVMLFIHGGGWRHGDKKMYAGLAQGYAKHGIGTVVVNYRLSPGVKHPAHVQDVAKAFAWTHRNIARYGGRPDRLFLCGHSSGGHLAALLATNPKYLEAERLAIGNIRGVIAVSGVYMIPFGDAPYYAEQLGYAIAFRGAYPLAPFTVEGRVTINPFRQPISADLLIRRAFGEDDPIARKDASPLLHINGAHPPFLVMYAENDFERCAEMSELFGTALKKCNCKVCTMELADRDHITTILWMMQKEDDPANVAIRRFVRDHSDPSSRGASPRAPRIAR